MGIAKIGLAMVATIAIVSHRSCGQAAPKREPQLWAVVVGIEYRDKGTLCPDAAKDATAFADWLQNSAKWSSENILRMDEIAGLESPSPANQPLAPLTPTREHLDWGMKTWLDQKVQPGDIVVFWFSGQAAVVKERQTGALREVLVPLDFSRDNLEQEGWSPEPAIDHLVAKFGSKAESDEPAIAIVTLLDTSVYGREKAFIAPPSADQFGGERFLNRLSRWPGATAWLAADGQPSDAVEHRSVFARAMASALSAEPTDLPSVLARLRNHPELQAQGFRNRGGMATRLTLDRKPVDKMVLPDRPQLSLQQGHSKIVTALVESTADNGHLLSASDDGTVREFSPDGAIDPLRPDLLRVFPHASEVKAMVATPNGHTMITGDADGNVRVYDENQKTPRILKTQRPHYSPIKALALSPRGLHMASLEERDDQKLVFWDLKNGGMVPETARTESNVTMMAASRVEGPAALAAVARKREILLFKADAMKGYVPIAAPGRLEETITAIDLSADGRFLAVGCDSGELFVWETANPKKLLYTRDLKRRITAVKLDFQGERLAFGLKSGGLGLIDLKTNRDPREILITEGKFDAIAFSNNGQRMAAHTFANDLYLWSFESRATPVMCALSPEGMAEGCSQFLFSADNRKLYAGKSDGTIRAWDLGGEPMIPPRPRFEVPAYRGRVATLAVSPDAANMIAITSGVNPMALLWDLKKGAVQTIPGSWISAFFPADGKLMILGADVQSGGEPTMFDRRTGERINTRFRRPKIGPEMAEAYVSFEEFAVSKDEIYLVGRTGGGQGGKTESYLCVWPMTGGNPMHVLKGASPATPFVTIAASLEDNGLWSVSRDGLVQLWDLETGTERKRFALRNENRPIAISSAAISTFKPLRIVTASDVAQEASIRQLDLWELAGDAFHRPKTFPSISGSKPAVSFLGDGKFVAAAGDNHFVRVWKVGEGQPIAAFPSPAEEVPIEAGNPERHHGDRVNRLIAWPSAGSENPLWASGSEDGSIRLWKLEPKPRGGTLLGVFMASPEPPRKAPVPTDRMRDVDWVAVTPDGVFHSTTNGEKLVRFLRGSRVLSMQQFEAVFSDVGLTDKLRQGICPQPKALVKTPPDLVIDPPQPDRIAERDVTLKVSWSDPQGRLSEIRLYQNGSPLRPQSAKPDKDGRGQVTVRVRLCDGENRFYVMGTCLGQVDARSREVPMVYTGPAKIAGKVHVIALGVNKYAPGNQLQYATKDAADLGSFFHQAGLDRDDTAGVKIVLQDGDVTREKVEDALVKIRDEVQGRPEDTVVLFLAGHADVIQADEQERFSLLLADFPFPEGQQAIATRGVRAGARGVVTARATLPYESLYGELVRMDALRRLVIVDACQAGAIEDEPRIQRLRHEMERGARKSRTSYFFAARRGELANEVSALEHGLLTYSLLAGMGAAGLAPLPVDLRDRYKAGADDNGDGTITTNELRGFAASLMKDLSNRFPEQIVREGTGPVEKLSTKSRIYQKVSTQAADDEFPLVSVKKR